MKLFNFTALLITVLATVACIQRTAVGQDVQSDVDFSIKIEGKQHSENAATQVQQVQPQVQSQPLVSSVPVAVAPAVVPVQLQPITLYRYPTWLERHRFNKWYRRNAIPVYSIPLAPGCCR